MWQIGIAVALEAAFWLGLVPHRQQRHDRRPGGLRAARGGVQHHAHRAATSAWSSAHWRPAAVIAADPTYRSIFFAGAGICAL